MKTTTYQYTDDGRRYSGVLVHPTCFPSPYGIGGLGQGAYDFIDFLEAAGQTLWQVLPLGPTGFGDSPYQSFSAFAGQPLLISPEKLLEVGLLTQEDIDSVPRPDFDDTCVDYGAVINYKDVLFHKAYRRFRAYVDPKMSTDFSDFYEKNKFWLDDYSFYMACKNYHQGHCFTEWPEELIHPTPEVRALWNDKLADIIRYRIFLQWVFHTQWDALHRYANERHIRIIGDIPIFTAFDSADVWAHPEYFLLDSKGFPTEVAGVPPDYFSEDGQLWGNPLYNWDVHKKDGYAWWIARIRHQLELTDLVRIDHFRGFCACWSVPAGETTAKNGSWMKGPGADLFEAFTEAFGEQLPIIAEDLGSITEDVTALRDRFGLPGMKILQFAFDGDYESSFLPHQFKTTNYICYTGTHDNDTTVGWYDHTTEANRDKVRRYMNTNASSISWDFIRICLGTIARYAIFTVQDMLKLPSEARMNTPGTPAGNWCWRFRSGELDAGMAEGLRQMTKLFGRQETDL